MTLTSSLFRRNAKLQACLREHSAHVTIGAVGEHVAKIQFALFEIDRLTIDRAELVAQRYGKSTAAAVLRYKKQRGIINRSYQVAADDIVGKMTIASLDKDMLLRERVPNRDSDCKIRASGGAPAAGASSLAAGGTGARGALGVGPTAPRVTANKQLGGVARIMVFAASNADRDGFPLLREIERARDCLAEHGVQLVVERTPGTRGVVPFVEPVIIDAKAKGGDNANELRKRCEDLVPGQPGILRIIVCRMGLFHFGDTLRDRIIGGKMFATFALLNTELVDLSNATLIHEMIHCSKPKAVEHDPEKNSVFFEFGEDRPDPDKKRPVRATLRPEHAATIASSFFSIGGPPKPKA